MCLTEIREPCPFSMIVMVSMCVDVDIDALSGTSRSETMVDADEWLSGVNGFLWWISPLPTQRGQKPGFSALAFL